MAGASEANLTIKLPQCPAVKASLTVGNLFFYAQDARAQTQFGRGTAMGG